MLCAKPERETLAKPMRAHGWRVFCAWMIALCVMAQGAHAEDDIDLESERSALETVKRDDLDAYFSYAQRAMKQRDAREAEWALRAMLEKNPALDRVRLELALSLISQGKFHEATDLLAAVLAKNPPAPVVKNIKNVMAIAEEALQTHRFGGGLTVGINRDTNANASPSSGDVTVLDTSIPLGAGAGEQDDMQTFVALNVSHAYRTDLEKDKRVLRWRTDLLEYRTKQATLHQLDLALHSVRTGPEISWLDEGVKLGVFASYNLYELNHYSYLRNTKGEYALDIQLTNDLVLQFNGLLEYRGFLNSPSVTTFEQRNGQAWQQGIGFRYILADDWIVSTNIYGRREEAKENFFQNGQVGANVGLTHLLSNDMFVNVNGGYRRFSFKDNDPLISQTVRLDNEYSGGVTFSRIFTIPENQQRVTLSTGYQYRDVQSNIQNYEFDNHRVTASFGINF